VVVLCRSWRPDSDVVARLSADARAALHLGWRVRKTFADGLLLEKDGRVAALVNEPQGELPTDEVIIDLIRRMETRGWSPIVCWRDAPRDPPELARLLQARSTALDKNAAVAKVVRQFVLSPARPVPEPPKDKGGATEWSKEDSSAPAVPELVADPIVSTAVLDDSVDRFGEIERASKAGNTQQNNGASPVAEDPASVAIQEASSFSATRGDKYLREEAIEAPGLSGNGHLNVPWSTNLKGEGSETVAQVDNNASATETTDAPHGAKAAAVEQPALSEASPALEVPSEPAPAPAVGSETVAQVDNTAGATETADALHRAEAAAVEQPALSEASPALEVSSEPAPAPAVAVDEEGQAATEHGGAPLLEKELTPRSPVGSNKPNSFGSS
jgi:hypothetical protein